MWYDVGLLACLVVQMHYRQHIPIINNQTLNLFESIESMRLVSAPLSAMFRLPILYVQFNESINQWKSLNQSYYDIHAALAHLLL